MKVCGSTTKIEKTHTIRKWKTQLRNLLATFPVCHCRDFQESQHRITVREILTLFPLVSGWLCLGADGALIQCLNSPTNNCLCSMRAIVLAMALCTNPNKEPISALMHETLFSMSFWWGMCPFISRMFLWQSMYFEYFYFTFVTSSCVFISTY